MGAVPCTDRSLRSPSRDARETRRTNQCSPHDFPSLPGPKPPNSAPCRPASHLTIGERAVSPMALSPPRSHHDKIRSCHPVSDRWWFLATRPTTRIGLAMKRKAEELNEGYWLRGEQDPGTRIRVWGNAQPQDERVKINTEFGPLWLDRGREYEVELT